MDPYQSSRKPQVSSAQYGEPPPPYSESTRHPSVTGHTITSPGANPTSRIPTMPVYSQDSPPPYSALPTNMAYVCTQPTRVVHELPPNDVTTGEPIWLPIAPPRIHDYMTFSIISLFLCLPLGVVALIYSFKTRSALERGDQEAAEKASRKSLFLNKISRFGILIIITLVAVFIFYFVRTWAG